MLKAAKKWKNTKIGFLPTISKAGPMNHGIIKFTIELNNVKLTEIVVKALALSIAIS